MKNYKFVEHRGTTCPVDPETMVLYRTTSIPTPVSHIHMPVKAGLLNWDDAEQYMGSILEYARYVPKTKYIEEEGALVVLHDHS